MRPRCCLAHKMWCGLITLLGWELLVVKRNEKLFIFSAFDHIYWWESTSEVRGSSPKLGYKIMSACFEASGATSSAGCERSDASGPQAWQRQEEASSDASGIRLVNRLIPTNLQRHKASSDYV